VSTQPILLISGFSPFCETFFDNVPGPESWSAKPVNRGWTCKYTAHRNAAMISVMASARRRPLGQGAADLDRQKRRSSRLEDAMLAFLPDRQFCSRSTERP